ncbi:CE051 protein, partial [Upupa epops]|nr:CE051 protein [Upupa epops]
TFLAKGSATLDKLEDLCNKEKEELPTLLQLYAQSVLDITYFEENQLVDENFLEESSLQRVKELICILSEPEDLVREYNINEPVDILGAELLECLYWRKGALLYMYCHTAKERKEWLQEDIAVFRKCLSDGVHYLMKMLSFRSSLQLNEDVTLQDKGTARLLSEGVFSDTHLLAMMYSGEMCYWGQLYCREGKEESCEQTDSVFSSIMGCRSQSVSLDFQETGKTMLTKYVTVCEGPLKGQGWNTAAARQMLCYFLKAHN